MGDVKSSNSKKSGGGINGFVVGLSVVVLVGVAFLTGRHYFGSFTPVTGDGGVASTQKQAGATIGGPFTLINQDGETVTDTDFRSKYMLIFFGYTYCPDVCPTGLARNSEALELLGEKGDAIVPVFVSVDPERDTVGLLKSFADFFHPRLVALTGTPEQVAAVAKDYRVYYAKVAEEDGAEDGTYLIDHSAITYLMGPDGKYVRHFGHNVSAERMAEQLREIL